MKLMIVEDERMEREALEKLIHLYYGERFEKILTASDGLEAVKCIRAEKPEIALMDVNLPFQSGIEAMKQVKIEGIETKFIMISAYSDYQYLREAMQLQAVDYILKPYSADTLRETIDKLLTELGKGEDLYGSLGVVQAVRHMLDTAYIENWSLDRIAEKVSLNKTYLGRIFRDETGMSVMSYLKMRRIETAKSLLMRGMTVNETAEAVGFEDASYFGRVFKQETGITAAQYRQKISEIE